MRQNKRIRLSLKRIQTDCCFLRDNLQGIQAIQKKLQYDIAKRMQLDRIAVYQIIKTYSKGSSISPNKENSNPNNKLSAKYIYDLQKLESESMGRSLLKDSQSWQTYEVKLERVKAQQKATISKTVIDKSLIVKSSLERQSVSKMSFANDLKSATSQDNQPKEFSLKKKILEELMQLKAMERKQNLLRNANQRLKECYSLNKKRFQDQTKNKSDTLTILNTDCKQDSKQERSLHKEYESTNYNSNLTSLNSTFRLRNNSQSYVLRERDKNVISNPSNQRESSSKQYGKITHCESEGNQHDSLMESKVSIRIEMPQRQHERLSLMCKNNHEYYIGPAIIDKSKASYLPHGNGSLVFCCEKMPIMKEQERSIFEKSGLRVHQKYQFYNGDFIRGKFEGLGTLGYRGKGDVRYVGQFKEGKRHGKGSLYCQGKTEAGVWQEDEFVKSM